MTSKEQTEQVIKKTIVSFAPMGYADTIIEELDRMNFDCSRKGWFDLLLNTIYKYCSGTPTGCISRNDFRRMMNEYMEREYKRLE